MNPHQVCKGLLCKPQSQPALSDLERDVPARGGENRTERGFNARPLAGQGLCPVALPSGDGHVAASEALSEDFLGQAEVHPSLPETHA